MFKTVILTAIVLAIALGVGAGTVWMALDRDFEFGTVTVGDWTAFPARGTPDADPYSKARFSRVPDLALGSAEGVSFIARRDTEGQLLRRECDYLLKGALPPARFWTLFARDTNDRVIAPANNRAAALHSFAMLRESDNMVVTTVSRHAAAGNWLATTGEGPFHLVLTFYDTATASAARIGEIELPRVTRVNCDG